ncbi:MAG: hypothetical protein JXR42_05605 [Gammaproteobacteria bacterium]|nr:hypothetical protein [Gammaproteobacteria bacterium]
MREDFVDVVVLSQGLIRVKYEERDIDGYAPGRVPVPPILEREAAEKLHEAARRAQEIGIIFCVRGAYAAADQFDGEFAWADTVRLRFLDEDTDKILTNEVRIEKLREIMSEFGFEYLEDLESLRYEYTIFDQPLTLHIDSFSRIFAKKRNKFSKREKKVWKHLEQILRQIRRFGELDPPKMIYVVTQLRKYNHFILKNKKLLTAIVKSLEGAVVDAQVSNDALRTEHCYLLMTLRFFLMHRLKWYLKKPYSLTVDESDEIKKSLNVLHEIADRDGARVADYFLMYEARCLIEYYEGRVKLIKRKGQAFDEVMDFLDIFKSHGSGIRYKHLEIIKRIFKNDVSQWCLYANATMLRDRSLSDMDFLRERFINIFHMYRAYGRRERREVNKLYANKKRKKIRFDWRVAYPYIIELERRLSRSNDVSFVDNVLDVIKDIIYARYSLLFCAVYHDDKHSRLATCEGVLHLLYTLSFSSATKDVARWNDVVVRANALIAKLLDIVANGEDNQSGKIFQKGDKFSFPYCKEFALYDERLQMASLTKVRSVDSVVAELIHESSLLAMGSDVSYSDSELLEGVPMSEKYPGSPKPSLSRDFMRHSSRFFLARSELSDTDITSRVSVSLTLD